MARDTREAVLNVVMCSDRHKELFKVNRRNGITESNGACCKAKDLRIRSIKIYRGSDCFSLRLSDLHIALRYAALFGSRYSRSSFATNSMLRIRELFATTGRDVVYVHLRYISACFLPFNEQTSDLVPLCFRIIHCGICIVLSSSFFRCWEIFAFSPFLPQRW